MPQPLPPRQLTSDLSSSYSAHTTPIAQSTTLMPNTNTTSGRLAPFRLPTTHHHSSSNDDINPSSHLYTGSGSTQGQISASTMADIVNYAEPGEDLDWTKITEPRERKRLQNIINGRKYRERRLAAEGQGGSGGNYPGAAGVGSYLSMGYGARRAETNPTVAAAATPNHISTGTPTPNAP